MNTQTHNIQHALLPIYIIKKSADGNVLNRKKIRFQINSGNTYRISYKFFMPRGFHLAPNTTPVVHCRLSNGNLNVPLVTFTYIQDGSTQQTQNSSITIKFLDANTGHQIDRQEVTGQIGQQIDVIHQVSIPSGYHLLSNQKTDLAFNNQPQVLSLLLRRNSAASDSQFQASTSTHADNQASDSDTTQDGLQIIQHGFKIYNRHLRHVILKRIVNGSFQLLKRVVNTLGRKSGDQSALRIDLAHHKIVGPMNSQTTHRIYLRARKYRHHLVSISEIRDFVTCVVDAHAERGVFITTSDFSNDAKREARRHHVKLISGNQLAKLMVKQNVGLKVSSVYRVSVLDPQFFN